MRKKVLPFALAALLLSAWHALAGGQADAGRAREPIKIGGLVPVTGDYAADGVVMQDAMNMAIEDLNAAGGVLGRPLKLIIFDIENMMAENLSAAAVKLIERDKVDFVITGWAGMGPDVEFFGKYDVPYMHFDGSSLTVQMVRDDPNKWNVFMMGDVEEPYGRLAIKILLGLPYNFSNKKVAKISGDFEWDRLLTEGMAKRFEDSGWAVVLNEVVPYGTSEWGPVLSKLRAADPAVIIFELVSPADAATFFRQWRANPTHSLLQFGYVLAIPEFLQILGSEADGVFGLTTNAPLPTPKGEEWKERFTKRFNKQPPLSIGGTVYDGMMAWAAAVKRVGKVSDYRAIAKALEDHPYEGVIGTYAWDKEHKVPAGPGLPMHYFQVQGGKAVLLYTDLRPVAGTRFILPPWLKP